jgi:hypothetical protein
MPRLEFNDAEQAIIAEADSMEASAKARRQEAYDLRDARARAAPAVERLTFAATWRCICGHGMAYDPLNELGSGKDSPFKMASQWECSAILLGIAGRKLRHTGPHSFATYEAKSEGQPSANGATTREPAEPHPDALSDAA